MLMWSINAPIFVTTDVHLYVQVYICNFKDLSILPNYAIDVKIALIHLLSPLVKVDLIQSDTVQVG